MSNGQVKILDGNTFVVSDALGDIEASLADPTGLFSFDTRFLSKWVLTIDGQRLNALSTDDLQYFESRFFLVPGTGTVYVDAKFSVIRSRSVANGFEEELTVLNHAAEPVDLDVRIEADSDFADLFEVKDALVKKGSYEKSVEKGDLVLRYRRETFERSTRIATNGEAKIDQGGISFKVGLEGHGRWTTRLQVKVSGGGLDLTHRGGIRARAHTPEAMARDLQSWLASAPRLEVGSDSLRATYRRSLVDLAALRFEAPVLPGHALPAAGLPWFMTMFGRDSIFTSLQALPYAPQLAASTLRALGARQGTHLDDFRDEDPGRILHEMRYGELTAFEERPHSAYYGCADATPLYVVLLDEYERWTGDTRLVRDLEFEARAALNWIDEYADLQGNGYVSYKRRNEATGLENQCWKDSWDSISFRDGALPGFPRATCELQGYAFDAKVRGARLARTVWHDLALAERLETEAAGLKRRFNRDFWVQDGQYYALRARPRRPPGRHADLEHRTSPLERHRRQVESKVGRRPSDGAPAILRMGCPHAGRGRGTLQPDRLSRGNNLAVRQLVHRLGVAPVRLQKGSGPDRRGHPVGSGILRRASSRSVRRLHARDHQVPCPVPDRVQPASVVHRGAAPSPAHHVGPRTNR
jgi:glycogen debranching enzyme